MNDYVPTEQSTMPSQSTLAASAEPAAVVPVFAAAPVPAHHFHKVVHNSRLVCWITMLMGPICALLGVFMIVEAGTLIFPLSGIGFMRVLAAVQWGLGGFSFTLMLHPLWVWGRTMLYKRAALDEKGVDFHLGTMKNPEQVFIPWNEITSIQQRRDRQITVNGTDGAYAQFTAQTFFRPGHLAKLISKHSGVPISMV